MGLGCGNPKAHASLKAGETVLDLGCGGGFDCFLAAREVGEGGRVIGVDMAPEMLSRARENAKKSGFPNVEFRLGEIEHLPVEDNGVDVVISNCVVNLSPEKRNVLREAFRVLKPGGRLTISDVLATRPLPENVKNDLDLVSACIGGAETIQSVEEMLEEAGFERIKISPREESRRIVKEWLPDSGVEDYVVSAMIEAVKPLNAGSSAVDAGTDGESTDVASIRKRAHGYTLRGHNLRILERLETKGQE
jgi:SAM-dependent methyltransferase